jgi:PmbA protein
MPETLIDQAAQAVELAKASGADDAWATASRSRSVEFTGRDGELEKVQENTSRSVSIELYVDGRYSTHSTTSLRAGRLESFVSEAVALTRALEPDEHRRLPDPALFEGRPEIELEIVDGSVPSIGREQRRTWLEELDTGARDDERVISATGYVADEETEEAAASSNGFSGSAMSTAIWVGASTTVQDEGDRRPSGGYWVGTRHVKGQPGIRSIGTEALRRALRQLGTTKGSTQQTTMIVDPQLGGRLVRSLMGPASARSVHQGKSFWAGKVGEKLFSELLTITDDPTIRRGLGSRLFDREGIAARPLQLVEAGVVRDLYVDTYYGRKTGMAPTTGSRSNVVVAPVVEKGLDELLADAVEGIYVTDWLGGNSDGTTGDYSLGVQGHLVVGGELGPFVSEMNITGNLADLFSGLVAVGNDPWPYRSTLTPTMVFEGVQFSGV